MRITRLLAALVGAVLLGGCDQLFAIEQANPVDGGALGDGGEAGAGPQRDASPPPVVGLGPGPYLLAYAGAGVASQVAQRVDVTVGGGVATAWTFAKDAAKIGTNTARDVGGDSGPVIWGRWAGGHTGAGLGAFNTVVTIPANAGLHYVVGRAPTKRQPTSGTLAYPLIGSTRVTQDDGANASGSVTGTASVHFTPSGASVGLSITMTIAGDATYVVESRNGGDAASSYLDTATSSDPIVDVRGALSDPSVPGLTGHACPGAAACPVSVKGFFAGDDYEQLALVVNIAGVFDPRSGPFPDPVTAVVVFARP